MSKIILLFFSFNLIFSFADPKQSGGAACVTDSDCSGINAGFCRSINNGSVVDDILNNSYVCQCFPHRGNPDCSYQRISKNLAGGLQFLCYAGVGGVGNFLLGRIGVAVGQLVIMVVPYILSCSVGCASLCCYFSGKKYIKLGGGVAGFVSCLFVSTILCGMIWNTFDAIQILNGKINDSKGYRLY